MITHGGNLSAAAKAFNIPESDWLDLSTGISPWTYPTPNIPDAIWRTLPYQDDELLLAAAQYYGTPIDHITPVSGSQDAIRRIPKLLDKSHIAIPFLGYKEHQLSWELAGHTVHLYHSFEELCSLLQHDAIDHCVLINPNNPSAEYWNIPQMEMVYQSISTRGYLFVDEAFMDVDEAHSIAMSHLSSKPQLIVLRSVGKFFGLAGLRLGFVLGSGNLVNHLRQDIMPWGVNHLAMFVGKHALNDTKWHQQQKQRIRHQEAKVFSLLKQTFDNTKGIDRMVSAGLFTTLFGHKDKLSSLLSCAAKQGILLRYDELSNQHAWLRFGLPGKSLSRFSYFLEGL